MTGIRREGDAPAAGREDVLLLEKVRRRTLEGKLPARDDILTMLAWKADSPQAVLLGKTARHMARLLAGNRGKVWAAIGVDCVPCPMDCAFCAFGQSRGIVRRARRWRGEEVVRAAAAFAAAGASWVVLRTTEAYGLEALCGLAARVRNVLPSSCCLVANTRQLDGPGAASLRRAGVGLLYHALRLGEGRDTPFDPRTRRQSLHRIHAEGLGPAHLVEPVGSEHTGEEIADVLLAGLESGTKVCGVMARVPVPGSPLASFPPVSGGRLAQLVAVTRLCCGPGTPDICVHPPVAQALDWGANVLVVETGAIPRDEEGAVRGPWQGFSVAEAARLLASCGYLTEAAQARPATLPDDARLRDGGQPAPDACRA